MHYVNKKAMDNLEYLKREAEDGTDLFDVGTMISECQVPFLSDYVYEQPKGERMVLELDILKYVYFNEPNFELMEPRYVVLSHDKRGDAVYYFNSKVRTVDCKYVGAFDSLYSDLGFTKENAEKLAEIVGGELVEAE